MIVPLRARGRIFGAFSLANERGRSMDPDDLFLAEELAARASMAIDNATLYEDRAYVARSLRTRLLVVGDVCGKGPTAAAVTGLIRSAVRTAALRESDPAGILRLVNESMLSQLDAPSLFTMVAAVFERTPGSIRVTTACAGHPLPLVVRGSGGVEAGAATGMLLGVFPDPALAEQVVELRPGDAYVVFTDGAIDPRNGASPGIIAAALGS